MSTITIELPSKLKAELARAARGQGISADQLVREALEARLKNGSTTTMPSLYDLSRDLCGTVAGGPADLARNKAHLRGFGAWER